MAEAFLRKDEGDDFFKRLLTATMSLKLFG